MFVCLLVCLFVYLRVCKKRRREEGSNDFYFSFPNSVAAFMHVLNISGRLMGGGFSSRVVVSMSLTQYNMETWSIATFKGMAIEKLVRQMKGKLEAAASRKSPGFTGTTDTGSTPFGQGNESAERTAESIRSHREQIHSSLMQDLLQSPQERDLFALRLIGKFQGTNDAKVSIYFRVLS